ncbi:N-acetylmuramoyl-L-alanine amidase [Inconstantimicrobium mannanitabidum]|uniref:Bacteriophage endolysin (N-acetylmuramoyl-L-alanine amidase) n=1 Tax=Inconstantimicrobium mannanitabidum TaxID=1604901 RepID=A0ACB5RA03_9CLOT|nr:N-acetylmuramoyl-L-alanine amidase [Clostridium sp. TW13]GKX65846.1 bacteriophage endolysin (N-acetylmuramoyl-L-alanine amidase) [Clostridium sp. TW13]
MKIAISCGHTLRGADTGARGYLIEENCTRDIANYAKQYLVEAGHTVVLCRIDDASSVIQSLQYRVDEANNANVDMFAEIHLNSGGGVGTEVYCVGLGGKAEQYAKQVLDKVVDLGYKNRGVKTANFYVIQYTKAPAILIECCFVDSQEDANRYNAKALGKAIAEGIINKSIENTVSNNKVAVNQNDSNNGGFKEMDKIYKNGSTPEPVYQTEACVDKIGSLDSYELCNAIADVNGKIVVLYNTKEGKKVGFVKYRAGL